MCVLLPSLQPLSCQACPLCPAVVSDHQQAQSRDPTFPHPMSGEVHVPYSMCSTVSLSTCLFACPLLHLCVFLSFHLATLFFPFLPSVPPLLRPLETLCSDTCESLVFRECVYACLCVCMSVNGCLCVWVSGCMGICACASMK